MILIFCVCTLCKCQTNVKTWQPYIHTEKKVQQFWQFFVFSRKYVLVELIPYTKSRQRSAYTLVTSTSQSYGDSKISVGGRGQNPITPEPIDKIFGVGDYVGDDSPHAKTQNVATYAWNITLAWFLAQDVIYTSRAYATMSVSVCLSVCLWLKCIGALQQI